MDSSNSISVCFFAFAFYCHCNLLPLDLSHLFSLDLNNGELTPGQDVTVSTNTGVKFNATLRFDTLPELNYFHHGGILNYVLRRLRKGSQ